MIPLCRARFHLCKNPKLEAKNIWILRIKENCILQFTFGNHTRIFKIMSQVHIFGPPCILLTLFDFGRQSRMEKTSLALPSGSSGRKTPRASSSIWYKQLENTGSGSSRRYSFSKPDTERWFEISNSGKGPICKRPPLSWL